MSEESGQSDVSASSDREESIEEDEIQLDDSTTVPLVPQTVATGNSIQNDVRNYLNR